MSKSRRGAPRRVAVGLLAGALIVAGTALAPTAGATTSVTTARYAGTNRYGTAAAVAGQPDFSAAKTAILATGENFPDALAASGLAGKNAPAPIVLTQRNTYTAEAKAALDALNSVTSVVIVGGTAAVSDSVKNAVAADGFTVTRVAGPTRFETAAEIGKQIGATNVGAVGGLKTALIATGTNFPDALAGGTLAYANKMPILLVTPDAVPPATQTAISDLGIKQAVILGGTAAVSDATKAKIDAMTGNPSIRVAGVNRFATAAAVGDFGVSKLGWAPNEVLLASGTNFPDALSGGPLGGARKAPILLLASVPPETAGFADAHSNTIGKVECLGGTAPCSDADLASVKTSAQNTANDGTAGKTSAPEIKQATVASVVTSGVNTGTTVRYTFDDIAIAAFSVVANFHTVTAAGVRSTAASLKQGPDLFTLDVLFTNLNTQALADAQTVATAEYKATQNNNGAFSPEGDAALAQSAGPGLVAGATTGPDLTNVQNFRAATTTLTAVDWVFDEAVATVVSNGSTPAPSTWILVTTTGATPFPALGCAFDSKSTDGLTITTVCTNNPSAPATPAATLTPTIFARGFIVADSVRDAGGDGNPDGAADIFNSGNSGTPDVVSGTIAFNGTNPDTLTVVFDQPVTSGSASAGSFVAYRSNSNQVAPPTTAATSATTTNSVLLTYPDGTLADVVGIAAYPFATTAGDGTTQGQPSLWDEVGLANAGTGTTGGRTDDPDLITAVRAPAVDIFNNPTGGFWITYGFDEDVATGTAANFFAYTANGTRFQGTTCTPLTIGNGGTEDTDATVRCSAFKNFVTGTTATNAEVQSFVLGTVVVGAVTAETGGAPNNAEGAEAVA